MNEITIRALRYYAGACMQKAVDPGLCAGVQIDYQLEAESAMLVADTLMGDMPQPGNVIQIESRRGANASAD